MRDEKIARKNSAAIVNNPSKDCSKRVEQTAKAKNVEIRKLFIFILGEKSKKKMCLVISNKIIVCVWCMRNRDKNSSKYLS